jgi:valyl-tRNA synthetase
MYKKVTRNIVEDIVEEHFDHPSAPQLKKLMEKSYRSSIAPVNVNTFKANIKDYFTDYNKKMTAIITGVSGTVDDLTKAEEEMFADIDNIGNLTKPYYGIEFGEKLNQAVRGYALSMAQVVNFIKAGLDIKNITNDRLINILSNDLSKMMNSYNNDWAQPIIKSFWVQICNHWIEAARARLRKDEDGEQAALANATRVMDIFSNSLASGIVAHFPNQFTTVENAIN